MLFRASSMMVVGLFIGAKFGRSLLFERSPGSHWMGPLLWFEIAGSIWMLVGLAASIGETRRGDEWRFVAAISIGALIAFENHTWAIIVFGAVMGTWMWIEGQTRHRSLFLAFTGWLGGGYIAMTSPWPIGQRWDLVFVIGGLATALQGGWEIPFKWSQLHRLPQSADGGNGGLQT